jgi:hypothetical protein
VAEQRFIWHADSLLWFGFMLYAAVLCSRSL